MSRCGLDPADCVTDHFCGHPELSGRKEPASWRMRCPVCKTRRALSVTVQGKRILWKCHHDPACDRDEIRAALALLLPLCVAAPKAKSAPKEAKPEGISAADMIEVAKSDLPPKALRLAMCQLAGLTATEARAVLGLSRTAYYAALQALRVPVPGQRRRSGLSVPECG